MQTRYGQSLDLDAAPRLEKLPPIDLLDFMCHMDRYAVERSAPPKGEYLFYPPGEGLRIAVTGRQTRWQRHVRQFESLEDPSLWQWEPQVVAAPLDALRHFAETAPARPLRNGLIAFSDIVQGPLAPDLADRLWAKFQVPVFEQLLGFDGEMLAWECEMHNGLHVRAKAAIFEQLPGERLLVSLLANRRLPVLRLETGMAGRITLEPCACGHQSPRITHLRRIALRAKSAAASAAAVG